MKGDVGDRNRAERLKRVGKEREPGLKMYLNVRVRARVNHVEVRARVCARAQGVYRR